MECPGLLKLWLGGALRKEILDHLPGMCLNDYEHGTLPLMKSSVDCKVVRSPVAHQVPLAVLML